MKKLLSTLLVFVAAISAQAQPFNSRPGPVIISQPGSGSGTVSSNDVWEIVQSIGVGGGAAVSNAYNLTFAINTRYTNNTIHMAVFQPVFSTSAGLNNFAIMESKLDTDADGDYDYVKPYYQLGTSSALAFTNSFDISVAPGAVVMFTNVAGIVATAFGSISYYSTNSGGGGGAGDVTQSGLAAGSYATGGKVRLIHNGVSTNSFTSITAAKTAAVAGDLIWVEPGNYYENNLLKSNVNYHFEPGVNIAFTNTADDWGIFDDRSTGTTTNSITGAANLYWRSFRETVHADAAIKLTNANTYFVATFGKILGDSASTNGEGPHVIDARGSNSWVSIKADELNTGNINLAGQVIGGIFWNNGEMFVNITHIGEFVNYGIWPDDVVGTVTNNLWVTSDLVECYIYAVGSSLNFRSWYDIKELRMTTNGLAKSAFGFFGGRHYVKVDKISSPGVSVDDVVFVVASGSEVWLDCQKLTRNGVSGKAIRVDAGTKLFANILHMEDTTTNTTPMIANSGELWLSGVVYSGRAPLITTAASGTLTRLSGIKATGTNAPAAIFADTNLTIIGSSLTSAISTNATVFSGSATNSDAFPSAPFGVLYRTNFNSSVVYTTTSLPVTNWNFAQLNGFTANVATGQLTNNVPGWYKVDFRIGLAAHDTDSVSINLAVFKNGVKAFANTSTDSQFLLSVDLAPIADQRWFFLSDVVWLPSGTAVDVRLEATSPTDLDQFSGRLIITKL
jgi:hypothetical protein